MQELISNIQEHHTAATNSFHQFMDSKVLQNPNSLVCIGYLKKIPIKIIIHLLTMQEQYLITYLQTESPTITPGRWIQLQQAVEIHDPLPAPPG